MGAGRRPLADLVRLDDENCQEMNALTPSQRNAPLLRTLCQGFIVAAIALVALGSASCGSNSNTGPSSTAVLVSIALTPPTPAVPLGSAQQFTAMGTFSDGSMQNLTDSVTWSSAFTDVATISATGLASGLHSGSTTIEAASGAVNKSTGLTVDAGVIAGGNMIAARENQTATLLSDGTVLVAGGASGAGVLASAEIYNPTTGTFALTGSMSTPRESHTATLLANGMVLIAGGDNGGGPLATAEIFNPATETFTLTGSMTIARESHTATLLFNGTVLIAGGDGPGGTPLATAELFNPATGTFTLTGSMSTARVFHTAAALFNGLALIAGGDNGSGAVATAELYDLNAGTFTLTGSMNAARESHTETLLNGGTVLITGGATSLNGTALASAEIYDPVAGTFTLTGSMTAPRYYQTATLLNNGTVLISGGKNSTGILASQELYDPNAGTFTATASMNAPRDPFTATLLNTGSVLITGGQSANSTILSAVDIFEPITLNILDLISIAVTPEAAAVVPGGTQQFTAVGSYSNGSSQTLASVTWSSNALGIATIGKTGVAVGVSFGTADINASAGSLTTATTAASAVLNVSTPDCLELTPTASVIAPRTTQQFSAAALFGIYGCDFVKGQQILGEDVTTSAKWTSSAPAVATVSTAGLVTAVGPGATTIQATYEGLAAASSVTVSSVSSIAVTPTNSTCLCSALFAAIATLGNGNQQTLSTAAWSSSAVAVATIDSAGLATDVGPGTTTIGASFAGITGSATFTVPSLVSVAVTPTNSAALPGSTQQFTATGIFSDGETKDYTAIAKWTSSAPGVATISPTGLATVVGLGPTTIQAVVTAVIGTTTVPAVTGSTTITGTNTGFVSTGSLSTARFAHTATQLDNGMILIAGGASSGGGALASAELYDPSTGKFTPTGNMIIARAGHTATLLNNGMVLITGGTDSFEAGADSAPLFFGDSLANAELYDPATGTFASTGSMITPRVSHTATLMNNGNVLIAGGVASGTGIAFASAELYDPATGTFTPTGNMISARGGHTATALNNGLVLIAGGSEIASNQPGSAISGGSIEGSVLSSAELYDPITGIFTQTGSMTGVRENHTATLLNNGTVLVAGGDNLTYRYSPCGTFGMMSCIFFSGTPLATAELYNPANGTFVSTGSMNGARHLHAATLLNDGQVLVDGGDDESFDDSGVTPTPAVSSAEVYDPGTGVFSFTGGMITARELHTATLLTNGNVLVAGGATSTIGISSASAELYEPNAFTPPGLVSITVTPANPSISAGASQHLIATGTFSGGSTEQLASLTWSSSNSAVATVSNDDSNAGTVIGAGGGAATITASDGSVSGSTIITVTAAPTLTGSFVYTGSSTTGRFAHTATLLDNGAVLVAGGSNGLNIALANTELYSLTAGTFTNSGSLNTARYAHTATLLNNGTVLIAGGANSTGPLASAEIYNPATGTLTATGSMITARQNHTATLLDNGMVLVAGGNDSGYLASAELYNPATGTFTATGSLSTARELHTATLLSNGMVLVAGGDNDGNALSSAELYNPTSGTFTLTGGMNIARTTHTAVLLNNGKVLIAGGEESNDVLGSAELYDPNSGTFALTGSMTSTREFHTATLLNNGTVLIAGGKSNPATEDVLASAEVYDPVAGTFAATGSLTTARYYHTATLLDNGGVLFVGGETFENDDSELVALASAELYTPISLTPPGLASIAVTPANPSISSGASQSFIATGTFTGGSTEHLASVTWSSSNSFVATVGNDTGDVAAATGIGGGTATITASAGSVSGSTILTVTGAVAGPTLTSIAATPVNPSISVGNTEQFTATGTFSDASTQNLTSTATWTSTATNVATISATGLATSVEPGPTTIRAAFDGITGSTTLTVTSVPVPTLTSIAVTPANPSITLGNTEQFTATGTFSDTSTQNLTNSATWTSTATGVATITSTGLASSVEPGPTTIQAALDGITGSTTLTVTSAAPGPFTIGGTVINLDFNSDGLDLQDNGGDDIFPNVNGAFTFPTALASGTPYSVTISRQPNDPAQNCVVIQGTGIATANVTNIVVNCRPGVWAWFGGADVFGQSGTYGTQGTAAASNVPGARDFAVTWTDTAGNFWLFGGNGVDSVGSVNDLNDLWEYSENPGQWTWMGGSKVVTTQAGVYGTLGTAAASNYPGGREMAATWTDAAGNFWLFGGDGYDSTGTSTSLNDLWKYNPSRNQWTWMAGSNAGNQNGIYGTMGTAAAGNAPGAREGASTWTDPAGNLWLFGGLGNDSAGSLGFLNDLWKFSPSTGKWTWMGGSNLIIQSGTYGNEGVPAAGNVPGARFRAMTWTDASGNFWLFGAATGLDSAGHEGALNDLWEYSSTTGQWAWMGGSNVEGQQGTYGTQGVAAASNIPGARGDAVTWTDASGNFWLFGGFGFDSQGESGNLGDLWEYSTTTGQWTWVSGSNVEGAFGQPVNYGTQGTPGLTLAPGARRDAVGWIDSNGTLWLFGGNGYDSAGNFGLLNDLWGFFPMAPEE
jgi:N-acetylneuraminic acid mutarotase/uncharacterized protein YjdB